MKNKPSVVIILLHGFFLIAANLFSIMTAFAIIQIAGLDGDKLIQGSIALLVNVIIYFLVFKLMAGIQKEIMQIDTISMLMVILMVSLALLPIVFYPMHFLTSGTWSSIDNLMTIWPFQFIVNALCLVLNYFVLSTKKV